MTYLIAGLAALLVGISKAGIKGINVFTVTLMVYGFGAKASTGIMLVMLMTGDILATIYYKKNCEWKYLIKFLPAMLVGVLLAVWLGKDISEETFRRWMGVIILLSVVMMWYREYKSEPSFPEGWLFAGTMGIAAGFTTMIGNLAGAFSNIFFLATGLPKKEFIGTAAYLFLIINLFKLPFHAFVWRTITLETLKINAAQTLIIVLGFIIGLRLVDLFKEQAFRKFILIVTAIGAVLIFVK